MSENDGGPAFPGVYGCDEEITKARIGMSLRDYFAGQALPALVTHYTDSYAAEKAYEYADAMIRERAK